MPVTDPLGLGIDFAGATDLHPTLKQSGGRLALAEAVARRLQCDRGALWYDTNYGTNIVRLVNATVRVETIGHMVEAEALKDERVRAASATVTQSGTSISITLRITDDDGPFTLTLAVSELSVEILDLAA